MNNNLKKTLGLSAIALLMTGCYTQLAVVERPVPIYAAVDQQHVEQRAAEDAYFNEDSYREGYDDAVSDLIYRDYSRQPMFDSREYELGYRDGFSDASWNFYIDRMRYGYSSRYLDPFYFDSYWAFHVNWNWHRHRHWYSFYGYGPYAYYSYPPYGHGFGWMGYGYWGPQPRTGWIVYYDYQNPGRNVHTGPRASGVNRDYSLREPNTRGVNRDGTRSVSTSGRESGVDRGTTGTRDRGTVTESGRTTNRGEAVGRTPATTRGTTVRPSTGSGTSTRSTPRTTNRGGSSGTVGSGSRPSSGSSSSGTRPRPNNRDNNNDDALSSGSTVVPRYAEPQPVREAPEVRVRQVVPRQSVRNEGSSDRPVRNDFDHSRPSVGTTFPVAPSQGIGTTATDRANTGRVSTFPDMGPTSRRPVGTSTTNTVQQQRPSSKPSTVRSAPDRSEVKPAEKSNSDSSKPARATTRRPAND
jgi:hypothetical protein